MPPTVNIRVTSKRFERPFQVTTLTVELRNLDSAFHGYRILQLTDLHRGYLTSLKLIELAISLGAAARPDLVVLTGDNVQLHHRTHPVPLSSRISRSIVPMVHQRRALRQVVIELAQSLTKLSPPDGFLAVLGNHDYLDGARTIRRFLGESIRWLINDGTVIRRGNGAIEIAGIDDLWYGNPDLEKTCGNFSPRIGETEANIPLRLLLSHNPDITLEAPFPRGREPHLILSGHTHGGQIRIPVLGPVITHTKSKVHVSGLTWCGDTAVYTCNGIGYGLLPLRFLCPPEILVVELQPLT